MQVDLCAITSLHPDCAVLLQVSQSRCTAKWCVSKTLMLVYMQVGKEALLHFMLH
jgi:hypothetical protein